MKIVVCAKQVPDTTIVKIDPVTHTMIRSGVPSILNPDDKNALEEALRLKDTSKDVHITVVSMGPPQASEMLKECLAMGADEAVLLSDRAFGGSDTWATSNAIAAAIRKMDYDLIFAGRQAIDGDTAQVGPQIAEKLGLPQVTYVQKFSIEGDTVTVQRLLEDGYEEIEVKLPCMLTCIKELNEPRYMSIGGIYEHFGEKSQVQVWTIDDIDLSKDKTGLKASPTKVKKSFTPEQKGKGMMLSGTVKEMTDDLVIRLKKKHAI